MRRPAATSGPITAMAGAITVAVALVMSAAPARASDSDCAPVASLLAAADGAAAQRIETARRKLSELPACGYLVADAARSGLPPGADRARIVDEALEQSRDWAPTTGPQRIGYLKAAILAGADPSLDLPKWRARVPTLVIEFGNLTSRREVAELDGALQHLRTADRDAEARRLEACTRFIRNPFDFAANCVPHDGMPADLRRRIQSAQEQRTLLDTACDTPRSPRNDDVGRCRAALNAARNLYVGASFDAYTPRLRAAEEQVALADMVAACTFQGGDTAPIESRVDQVMRCDRLLRNKDPNKETIRASRDALAGELRRLEPRLRPTGDLAEIKRICDLRTRLAPYAEFYGTRFPDVCPAIPQDVAATEQALKSYIERPAIARPQQGSRNRLSLPGFAQKFDDDCLDKLTELRVTTDRQARFARPDFPSGSYINGCSPVLGSIIQRLAGLRLGELLGAPAVPPAPRGQKGTAFIRPEEILSRWTGMATDRILLPSTAAVLEQEAALIAEFVNYRAETIERALGERCQGRPESGLLTWLGGNRPNVQAATDSFQKLTEATSPLGRLLDPAKQTEISSKIAAWRQPGALCQQAAQPTAVSASPPVQAPVQSQPAPTVQTVPQPQPSMRPAGQTGQVPGGREVCGRSANLPTLDCIEEIRRSFALENAARSGPVRLTIANLRTTLQQLPPQLKDSLVTKANDNLYDAERRCDALVVRDWTTISQELRVMADLFDDLSASLMLRSSKTTEDCIPVARRN